MEFYFIDALGVEHIVQRSGACASKSVRINFLTWRVEVLDENGRVEGVFALEIKRDNVQGRSSGRRLTRSLSRR